MSSSKISVLLKSHLRDQKHQEGTVRVTLFLDGKLHLSELLSVNTFFTSFLKFAWNFLIKWVGTQGGDDRKMGMNTI